MSIEKIYDIETGETTEVPLSEQKLESLADFTKKMELEIKTEKAKQLAKSAALAKLGLTNEEISALGLLHNL